MKEATFGTGHICCQIVYAARMLWLILNWVASAVSLLIVAHVIRGFEVDSFLAALIAAFAIGLVNATLGVFLKIVTLPLAIVTFGIFWFVINALMLKLAAMLVPGFAIDGFLPAFFGAIVLSVINLIFKLISRSMVDDRRG